MKKRNLILASLACALSCSVVYGATVMVPHIAVMPHVVAPHVTAPIEIIAPHVNSPSVPKPSAIVEQEPAANYAPKVNTIYVPKNAHFIVPRGTMQEFCKDPNKYRTAHPIPFSEEEFRGMVAACFRFEQEGKQPGDYIK